MVTRAQHAAAHGVYPPHPSMAVPFTGQIPEPGEEEAQFVSYDGAADVLPTGFDSEGIVPTYPTQPLPPLGTTTLPAVPGAYPVVPAFFGLAIAGVWILRLAGLIARFAAARGISFAGAVAFIRMNGMTILKWGGIAALGAWLIDLIDADPEQARQAAEEILVEMQQKEARGKRRRYTIGHNPRVRTLQRVSRHCMRMLKRHDKYIREFFPKPRYKVPRPAARYLSPIEKAQLQLK